MVIFRQTIRSGIAQSSLPDLESGNMRAQTGCLLLVASSLLAAQTSQELRSRYGAPNRERFAARPGISVTVEYDSHGLVCEELLEPPQPLLRAPNQDAFMSSDAVTDVLEELVPLGSRGPQIGSMITNSGCNQMRLTDYLLVSITRSTHNCLPLRPEREMRAALSFKRDTCQNHR
jgi:hypothetical protein